MPITKGKYRRATIDFTERENEELQAHIRAVGCQKAKFVRAAVAYAIRIGLTSVEPPPPLAAPSRFGQEPVTHVPFDFRKFKDGNPPKVR